MDTVGNLLDRLCILERRMIETRDEDVFNDLKQQRHWMFFALGKMLVSISEGNRPAMFKKHKQYDKDVQGEEIIYFVEALKELQYRNNCLWDLEDKRRNLSLSNNERLKAADEISIQNKLRNDSIDRIDSIISISKKEV